MEVPRLEVWMGALRVGLVAPSGVPWSWEVGEVCGVGYVDQDALRSHSFAPKLILKAGLVVGQGLIQAYQNSTGRDRTAALGKRSTV